MALVIVTITAAKTLESQSKKYNSYYEGFLGNAKRDYICDVTDEKILAGEPCVAAIVLVNSSHPNLNHQRSMVTDYITLEEDFKK